MSDESYKVTFREHRWLRKDWVSFKLFKVYSYEGYSTIRDQLVRGSLNKITGKINIWSWLDSYHLINYYSDLVREKWATKRFQTEETLFKGCDLILDTNHNKTIMRFNEIIIKVSPENIISFEAKPYSIEGLTTKHTHKSCSVKSKQKSKNKRSKK